MLSDYETVNQLTKTFAKSGLTVKDTFAAVYWTNSSV